MSRPILVNIICIFDNAPVSAEQHFKFHFGSLCHLVRICCTGCSDIALQEGSHLMHACCMVQQFTSTSGKRE